MSRTGTVPLTMPGPAPADLPLEHAVLGAALLEPRAVPAVAAFGPALFFKDAHRDIHAAIRDLAAQGRGVDAHTVAAVLQQNGQLEAIGGSAYLSILEAEAAVSTLLPEYVERLRVLAFQRAGMRGTYELGTQARRNGGATGMAAFLGRVDSWRDELAALADGDGAAQNGTARQTGPWARATPAPEFLLAADIACAFLEDRLLAAGSITELFSPRGLGKTHVAYALAVKHATAGRRVLLLDRDNSRREVQRRLRAWGAADTPALKVLTRDQVPPLTDAAAWKSFPFAAYDLVIIDSIDASTEGVGEQDSSKPSRAIAPLLDIAHREAGPAILALGNTIKSAEHSRGSGIVEDRADVVYEVRDATDLKATGTKPWWLELPAAGVGAWAERAARRKRRDTYRLAFVPSKFRLGEEPDPFALEVDLATEPWRLRDVTAEVVAAGEASRAAVEQERHQKREAATDALRREVARQAAAGTPLLARTDAEPFLMERGLSRKAAREVIATGEGQLWQTVTQREERGQPRVLMPLSTGPDFDSGRPPSDSYLKGSGQNQGVSEFPHGERASETAILAGRTGSGRPESTPLAPAPDAAMVNPSDFGRALREPPGGASARIVEGVVQEEPEEEVLELAVSPEDLVSRTSDPAGAAAGGPRP